VTPFAWHSPDNRDLPDIYIIDLLPWHQTFVLSVRASASLSPGITLRPSASSNSR
jgi:hypothetical protein